MGSQIRLWVLNFLPSIFPKCGISNVGSYVLEENFSSGYNLGGGNRRLSPCYDATAKHFCNCNWWSVAPENFWPGDRPSHPLPSSWLYGASCIHLGNVDEVLVAE